MRNARAKISGGKKKSVHDRSENLEILACCERFWRDANDFSVSHETDPLPGN
jgi:hypothetical protein